MIDNNPQLMGSNNTELTSGRPTPGAITTGRILKERGKSHSTIRVTHPRGEGTIQDQAATRSFRIAGVAPLFPAALLPRFAVFMSPIMKSLIACATRSAAAINALSR